MSFGFARRGVAILSTVFASAAFASIPPTSTAKKSNSSLNERLSRVRAEVVNLEQSLIGSLERNKEAKDSLRKIQELIRLQKEESTLGQTRIRELEDTVRELESRRGVIRERVGIERAAIRKALRDLYLADSVMPENPDALAREKFEQPKRHLIRRMVQQGVREVDALRADLEDADRLEARIAAERGELEATVHEMAESEGILELNRQLQLDLIQKNRGERVAQLEKWRELKTAEAQVSDLIRNFNARMEIQETHRAERAASRAMAVMADSTFAKAKGKLPFPALGEVVGRFGKTFDKASGLNVFKKGIEIATAASTDIRAISPGKIVYAGDLPTYGRLAIVDHGDHFYSICGHLGDLAKRVGDSVAMGEKIGVSDSSGNPVYFEIRARNIPVDPLQWVTANIAAKL
ncbi:MAG: peptidoglycan DD-metalloendopeptidase family protein [Bdellovibrionales bacterium]|nr:peptidoglycan DD-metalloendopeptidase family protein [Bdellovibrionales bacterium]